MSTHSYVIENNADLKVGRKAREAWQREAQALVCSYVVRKRVVRQAPTHKLLTNLSCKITSYK